MQWLVDTRPYGPMRIELRAEECVEAELALIALPCRLQVPLLRRALEINRHLHSIRLVLRGDRIFARCDTRLTETTTTEFITALNELAQAGPMLADDFRQRFAARPLIAQTFDDGTSSVQHTTAAPIVAPDLASQVREAEVNAAEVCEHVTRWLSVLRPLTFQREHAVTCVLILRVLIINLSLDGDAPDVASRLMHHGAGLLKPLWPGNTEGGWLRGLGRRNTPVEHAVSMVLPIVSMLERVLADRGQVEPQPPRSLPPLDVARHVKGQAEGVVRYLSTADLSDDVRRWIVRGTVRELLARGRLPSTIKQRLEAALRQPDDNIVVVALRSLTT